MVIAWGSKLSGGATKKKERTTKGKCEGAHGGGGKREKEVDAEERAVNQDESESSYTGGKRLHAGARKTKFWGKRVGWKMKRTKRTQKLKETEGGHGLNNQKGVKKENRQRLEKGKAQRVVKVADRIRNERKKRRNEEGGRRRRVK